jgi:DNA-binding MarR family transcriptional regulator
MSQRRRIRDADYKRLLTVRTALRRFERWSADQAADHGLTTSQHQLLLAIRGHEQPQGPTIGQVADYLLTRHHSAVELVDRTERLGLIIRSRDPDDHRAVRLTLADRGTRVLESLTSAHLEELARLTTLFQALAGTLTK